MADLTSAVNVEELRRAQGRLNEGADDTYSQYGNANSSVETHVGNEGDGSLGGKLGNFVSGQWDSDTSALVNRYKEHANYLLNDALSSITHGAENLSSETESIYK